MRIVVLVTLFLSSTLFSADAPYYRFWRGYKRQVHVKDSGKRDAEGYKIFVDDPSRPLSTKDFRQLVNEWLIPATTSCCAQSSLIAYLPVLLAEGEKPANLQDEIALIVYASEDAYKKTRADKENIEAYTYGPLHSDVFAMGDTKSEDFMVRLKSSRSLVPVPFTGKVDLTPTKDNNMLHEAAYDVLNTAVDWQKGFTLFRVSFTKKGGKDFLANVERHLSDLKANGAKLNLLGYAILVTKDYVIEYQNWLDRAAWKAHYHRAAVPDTKPYVELVANDLKQQPSETELRYTPLDFKEAGTVLFPIGKKPIPAIKHHRLDPLKK